MFSRLAREDWAWPRCRKALPLFLLLWCGGALLALLFLIMARDHLHRLEQAESERLLDLYLAMHRALPRHSGPLPQTENLPPGLTFVRVAYEGEQLLLVGAEVPTSNFRGFVEMSPDQAGMWLSVAGVEGPLTVIVRRFDNGVAIQAGKDGRQSHALFVRFWRTALLLVLLSGVLLWPLVLLQVKLSLAPLGKSRELIDRLMQRPTETMLPEWGNGPELDGLYQRINQLIRHNRRLVVEMQQSLDNVAHDLRTPMTRLRSVAEYGLQAENDPGRLREALSDCLEESERVLAMLRIMMSVAEAESGTMRLERQQCDLTASLEQVLTLYEYVAEERNITVELGVTEPLLAWVDETRIAQVWANLLDNAIKYGRDGGWVKIVAGPVQGGVEVRFSDNGMGISLSEQGRIWERLYRGDRSRSQKGLGLGLSYVRAVVEAHGGTATVASDLHQGSAFTVRLPPLQENMQEKSQTRGE
jgi:signal transduction histidine kinase